MIHRAVQKAELFLTNCRNNSHPVKIERDIDRKGLEWYLTGHHGSREQNTSRESLIESDLARVTGVAVFCQNSARVNSYDCDGE